MSEQNNFWPASSKLGGSEVEHLPPGAHRVEDQSELETFFSDEPAAHVYGLADLEDPFWEPSVWIRRADAVVGLVRLPDSQATTVYAVATRDPAGTLQLVVDLLPMISPGTLITAPSGLPEALGSHRGVTWSAPHMRYVLDDICKAGVAVEASPLGVTSIDRDRVEDLQDLYAADPGAAFFLPSMVDHESFVGVYEGGQLVAAAGTHVLSTTKRCAAIGGVYVKPSHRGLGLSKAVTAGVVGRIRDRIDLIGLNVAMGNAPARAAYTRLGFRPILTYSEAEVQ